MTETWTTEDDAIMEARARAKRAGDLVSTTPGNPEAVLESCIGDRVRPGHEAAMDEVIAQVNREMAAWMTAEDEWVWPPFEYVREGDLVFLQSRYMPDELDDVQLWSLNREFERIMINYIPDDLFEEHMESLHVEDDDDCGCDACFEAYEAGTSL